VRSTWRSGNGCTTSADPWASRSSGVDATADLPTGEYLILSASVEKTDEDPTVGPDSEAPWRFPGGTLHRVAVHVSGAPDLDLEREAAAMLSGR